MAAIQALNDGKEEIVVIGQDEKDVGGTDSSQWWEEERSVEELLLHPDCEPDTAPQYCVVALVLSQQFSMNTSLQYRPRPACLTCLVEDINSKLLKGETVPAST